MIRATVAIGSLGVGVWAHHMFTIGMSSMANTFFMIATMAVGVPTGIKIFNRLACSPTMTSASRYSSATELPWPA